LDDFEAARKKCVITVDVLDYSRTLDLIAFGGIQGKLCVIDAATMIFKGMYDAHKNTEIVGLYFYDSQRELVSLAVDGDVKLWDAQKMEVLQTVRSRGIINKTSINSAYFCSHTATLLLATSKIFKWNLKEDPETRILIEQQHAVARDYLSQYRKGLEKTGVLKEQNETPMTAVSDEIIPSNKVVGKRQM
jgi:WD40 repeat protein